jgi:hypothetical protein
VSIRDQLKSKQPHTTSITFPTGETGEAAKREVEQARRDLELQRLYAAREQSKGAGGKKVSLTVAQNRLKKAEAVYAKVSMTLVFRGLAPGEVDALVDEFTVPDPPEGEQAQPFNSRGYTGALLAACVVDSDLTAAEWDAELYESKRWSDGEVTQIREAARAAYNETPAPGIPKG